MGKDLKISILIDFYGEMLTDKQKDVMELYYNEDLSLAEIAEHEHITRQGVRDSIKHGEITLRELEDKLKMVDKFTKCSELFEQIKNLADLVYEESSTYNYSRSITNNANSILKCIEESNDIL